jgi:hypothetical protein
MFDLQPPRHISTLHTASIRCGTKVRTRSERSGHAESVGSGSIRRRKTVTRASPRILRAANGRGDALTFRKLALGYIQPVDGVIPGDKGQDPA